MNVQEFNMGIIRFAEDKGFENIRYEIDDADEEDKCQVLNDISDCAINYLNGEVENAPHTYWDIDECQLMLKPDLESLNDNAEFKSSKEQEYPPDGFVGEWIHVNDHGNVTFYFRKPNNEDVEIWSVV